MPVGRRRIDRTRHNKGPPLKQMLLAARGDSGAGGGSSSSSSASSGDDGAAEEKKQERERSSDDEDEAYEQEDSHSSSQASGDGSSSSDHSVRRQRASPAGDRRNAKTSTARKKKAKAPPPPSPRGRDKMKARRSQAQPAARQTRREAESDDEDADAAQSDDQGSKYSFKDDSNDEDYREGQDGGGDDDESLGFIDDDPLASPWGTVRKRRRRRKDDSSSESEFLDEASSASGSSSNGDEENAPRGPRQQRGPSGNRRRSRLGKPKRDDPDDESSSSSAGESGFGSPSRSRKRRSAKRSASAAASSRRRSTPPSEDESSGPSPKPAPRLMRKSPASARKDRGALESSESEDSNLNQVTESQGKRRARLERLSESRRQRRRRVSIQEVRDEDVGDSEESSTSEDRKMRRATQEKQVYSDLDEGEDSSSVGESGKPASGNVDSPRRRRIDCPSQSDAITEEDLPPMHVCFCTPDGADRYCFALETLRQIALTSLDPKTDAQGKLTFLQPLHFRTAMSDDLIDQIASRFGRDALDVTGPFYDRSSASVGVSAFDPPSLAVYDETTEFTKRVRKFGRSIMGSRDLYVCPLCYTVAYQRMMDSREGAETTRRDRRDIAEAYVVDFHEDPMYILGDLDGDELNAAATFCFSSIKKVESHLLRDHRVTPRKTHRDLYARYAIRKQDGLVQRFVHSIAGNVMHYWLDGYNFEFVYLVQQTDKASACRAIVDRNELDDPEELTEATEFLEKGTNFFVSFQKDAEALWDAISAPYSTRDDIGNFVVKDGAEEEDPDAGRVAHLAFVRQGMEDEMEEDKKWVERLQRMAGDNGEEEADDEEHDDESDVHRETARQQGDGDVSSEESEDEWMAEKRVSMEARRAKGRAKAGTKRHQRGASAPVGRDGALPPARKLARKVKKRRSLQDSEDE